MIRHARNAHLSMIFEPLHTSGSCSSIHHGRPDARFLVRLRLDLFLSGGGAHPAAGRGPRTSRCAFGPSCSGRSSRRRAGTPRRSTSTRPRAATCGATWSGLRPTSTCRSAGPMPFPQNSLLAARVALVGLPQGWGEDYSVARVPRRVRSGRAGSTTPATRAAILAGLNVDPQGRARRRAIGRHQGCACGRRPRRHSGSACSARQASSPRTASCSGATTGWSRRSRWAQRGVIGC